MRDDEHDLPDGWKLVAAGDIAEVVGGGTPKTTVAGNFSDDGGHPWITPADLTGYTEKYISRGRRNLTDQGLATSSAKYMPAGTVLYSTRAPIGYVAIAENPVTTNQGFRSFVPSSAVESEYLYYGLKLARQEAEQLARGTTFAELSGTNAKKLHVPLAPLDVQRQIVRLLDAASTSNASARLHIAAAARAVERFRQSVLAAAYSGRLTRDWRLAHSASVEPAFDFLRRLSDARNGAVKKQPLAPFVDAGFPDNPDGWEWASADALTTLITKGTTPPGTDMSQGAGDIPYLKVYNLTFDGTVDFTVNPTFVPRGVHDGLLKRSRVFPGDLLLNIVGPPLGKVGVVPETYPEWNINQAIAVFRLLPGVNTEYLKLWLLSSQLMSHFARRAKATAGQYNLTLEICRELPVPIPPADEQAEIVRRVEYLLQFAAKVHSRIDAVSKRVDRTSQAVLAKAFRGELLA